MKHRATSVLESFWKFSFVGEAERELAETLEAVGRGETTWSTVLAQLETLDVLSVLYLRLIQDLRTHFVAVATPIEREVQLRLWLVFLHKMGRYWSTYRFVEGGSVQTDEEWLEMLAYADQATVEKWTWFQLLALLLEARTELEELEPLNFIQAGIKQEILLIIGMLEPQERIVFDKEQQWQTEDLWFRPIQATDGAYLQQHFTPSIGQYLSIDSFAHPTLVAAYIKQSQVEMEHGTCLVLLVFERDSQDFVGCLTLNDIHHYSVEIGLWVSENKQGKGYGSALLKQAIAIIETSIPTQQIIYTVEKENQRSIALCEHYGFQHTQELILEPTPLKNKYRTMSQYVRMVGEKGE
ncbi:GNAT family N-acetyltransferase [Myroides odoratus]